MSYRNIFVLDSCQDVYKGGHHNNGTYTIYNRKNQSYDVYCEFHKTNGYAYVSRRANVEINVDDLYTTRERAKIRIQKPSFREAETIVENLSMYKSKYPLGFQYNKNDNYTQPLNHAKLAPFLFLGFLPASAANHVQPQGYRANGKDYPFTNCDGNPNSYMAFYFNPHHNAEVGYKLPWRSVDA